MGWAVTWQAGAGSPRAARARIQGRHGAHGPPGMCGLLGAILSMGIPGPPRPFMPPGRARDPARVRAVTARQGFFLVEPAEAGSDDGREGHEVAARPGAHGSARTSTTPVTGPRRHRGIIRRLAVLQLGEMGTSSRRRAIHRLRAKSRRSPAPVGADGWKPPSPKREKEARGLPHRAAQGRQHARPDACGSPHRQTPGRNAPKALQEGPGPHRGERARGGDEHRQPRPQAHEGLEEHRTPRAKPMRPEMPSRRSARAGPTGRARQAPERSSTTVAAPGRRVMFTVGLPTRWPARLKHRVATSRRQQGGEFAGWRMGYPMNLIYEAKRFGSEIASQSPFQARPLKDQEAHSTRPRPRRHLITPEVPAHRPGRHAGNCEEVSDPPPPAPEGVPRT